MSFRPHIAVVDPASRVPELECFNNLAHRAPVPLTYHLPGIQGIRSLRDERLVDLKGVIIFGSGCSVHDREPWQEPLEDWLRPLLEAGMPTLGLCYGHQMLAHMFGAKVGFLFEDQHKLKGFRKVAVDATAAWPKNTGTMVVSHREVVLSCPADMRVMARSQAVEIDGLAHTHLPIWSFQPHPEATPAFLENQDIAPTGPGDSFDFGHGLVARFMAYAASR